MLNFSTRVGRTAIASLCYHTIILSCSLCLCLIKFLGRVLGLVRQAARPMWELLLILLLCMPRLKATQNRGSLLGREVCQMGRLLGGALACCICVHSLHHTTHLILL